MSDDLASIPRRRGRPPGSLSKKSILRNQMAVQELSAVLQKPHSWRHGPKAFFEAIMADGDAPLDCRMAAANALLRHAEAMTRVKFDDVKKLSAGERRHRIIELLKQLDDGHLGFIQGNQND